MKPRLLFFSLLAIGALALQCGIFEPETPNGSMQITVVRKDSQISNVGGVPQSALAMPTLSIEYLHCIVQHSQKTDFDEFLDKIGGSFYAEITGLEKGNNYSVFLDGQNAQGKTVSHGEKHGIIVRPGETSYETITMDNIPLSLDVSIVPSEAGSVTKSPDKAKYNDDELVVLTAVPDSGYRFDHWEGRLSGSGNPDSLVMNDNKSVTAYFVSPGESISPPSTPTGPKSGKVGQILNYCNSSSTSSLGHHLEYRFDWGAGPASSWGASCQSHSYSTAASYSVKAQARCQTHTNVQSDWSSGWPVSLSGHRLTVTVSPPGTGHVIKNPDKSEYDHNEVVQLKAVPNSDYQFDHWEDALGGSINPDTLTMSDNKSVTAHFVSPGESISPPSTPTGPTSGKVGQMLNHCVGGSASSLGHNLEYQFYWGDDGTNWGASCRSHSYSKVGSYRVKANARCQTHTNVMSDSSSGLPVSISGHRLTVTVSPPGSGSVIKNPDKSEYDHNEVVQLTAVPNSGYEFDRWEGGYLTGSINPDDITMDGDKTVTAIFVAESISTPSRPTGSTNGKVGQILNYCTGGSTSSLGHSIEYHFDWGDGATSNWGASCQSHSYLTVGSYSVKAQARCQTHTNVQSAWSIGLPVDISGHRLTVTVSPPGSGNVTKNPDKSQYEHNEVVRLTAVPNMGYEFDRWEGHVSEKNNPVNITMGVGGDKVVTAHFVTESISTPSTPTGPASGKVGQILNYCTGGSTNSLGHPLEYRFDWGDGATSNWGSSCQSHGYSTVGSYSVKSQARCQTHTNVVSAWSSGLSVSMSGHTLTVNVSPAGSGSVTRNPNKSEYDHNEVVQLTASANSGYQFDHWGGHLNGSSNPANITMNGDKTVTAYFEVAVRTWSDNAVKDAFVATELSDNNFGTDSNFIVAYDSFRNSVFRSLIEFSFLADIPTGATIISAKLRLTKSSLTFDKGVPFEIYIGYIIGGWSENQVTWNSQPSFNLELLRTVGSNLTQEFDVTEVVKKMVQSRYEGFYMRCKTESGSDKTAFFESRENSQTSERPYLEIKYIQ